MSTRTALAGVILAATVLPASAEDPLSAIDWLSDSVTDPGPAAIIEPPQGAPSEEITVQPLDAPSLDAVGLVPHATLGLPANTWQASQTADVIARLAARSPSPLPAVNSFFQTLLLAELPPPGGERTDGELLLTRLDALLTLGALDPAQALLERAGPTDPALFRRWFDVSLLTGQEDRACTAMRAAPGIAPTFPARVFCLARGGDWNAALLTLDTAKALGFVTEAEDALLIRFLDPELFEGEPPLPQPPRPSPLVFRMFEAIGEYLSTTTLPVAFANADLRYTAGWKARIEAAERLAATGAIDANRLIGIYTERKPAASGGVWDRVAAVQKLDVALLSGDAHIVADALPGAWAAVQRAEIEVPFAQLYAERLNRMALPHEAAALAFRIGMFSDGYEALAAGRTAFTADEAFLIGLAKGAPPTAPAHRQDMIAVAEGFAAQPLPETAETLLRQNRLGEALLSALDLLDSGARGDLPDLTAGLSILRKVGLEDLARQAALQALLLDRRG